MKLAIEILRVLLDEGAMTNYDLQVDYFAVRKWQAVNEALRSLLDAGVICVDNLEACVFTDNKAIIVPQPMSEAYIKGYEAAQSELVDEPVQPIWIIISSK